MDYRFNRSGLWWGEEGKRFFFEKKKQKTFDSSGSRSDETDMETQLNRGLKRRLMYVENKDGQIGGAEGRIDWVGFPGPVRRFIIAAGSWRKPKVVVYAAISSTLPSMPTRGMPTMR